jgi:hypothetical protein
MTGPFERRRWFEYFADLAHSAKVAPAVFRNQACEKCFGSDTDPACLRSDMPAPWFVGAFTAPPTIGGKSRDS